MFKKIFDKLFRPYTEKGKKVQQLNPYALSKAARKAKKIKRAMQSKSRRKLRTK